MHQARQVAAALSQLPVKLIASSPLRRAADTAGRIRESCGAELRLDPRLAEQGKSPAEASLDEMETLWQQAKK